MARPEGPRKPYEACLAKNSDQVIKIALMPESVKHGNRHGMRTCRSEIVRIDVASTPTELLSAISLPFLPCRLPCFNHSPGH